MKYISLGEIDIAGNISIIIIIWTPIQPFFTFLFVKIWFLFYIVIKQKITFYLNKKESFDGEYGKLQQWIGRQFRDLVYFWIINFDTYSNKNEKKLELASRKARFSDKISDKA